MRQYRSWQAPFYSFWSKSFYIDVAKNWNGLAYLYLLCLLCFTWLFLSIKWQIDFAYSADQYIKPLIPQMPVITIDKGTASIDKPSPYTITASDGNPKITFDTREKPLSAAGAPGIFLVTKKMVIFKPGELDKQILEAREGKGTLNPAIVHQPTNDIDLFSLWDHIVYDQNADVELIDTIKKFVAVFVFPIALLLGYVLCILQSSVYGLLAMAIAKANQINLSYAAAVRLSVVAMTPTILMDSLLKLRNLDSILWGPIAMIGTIGYIMFAVRANADRNEQSQPSNS